MIGRMIRTSYFRGFTLVEDLSTGYILWLWSWSIYCHDRTLTSQIMSISKKAGSPNEVKATFIIWLHLGLIVPLAGNIFTICETKIQSKFQYGLNYNC